MSCETNRTKAKSCPTALLRSGHLEFQQLQEQKSILAFTYFAKFSSKAAVIWILNNGIGYLRPMSEYVSPLVLPEALQLRDSKHSYCGGTDPTKLSITGQHSCNLFMNLLIKSSLLPRKQKLLEAPSLRKLPSKSKPSGRRET